MPSLELLVFDGRRGNTDGRQQEKMLGFFPAATPVPQQAALAGLLQGLALFATNFVQGQAAWDVVETDGALWTLRQVEPGVFFAASADKAWLPRHVTQDNLQALLVHAHQLVRVVHGSVQSILDEDDSGSAARAAIGGVLNHLGEQLGSSASWAHRELRNPFTRLATPPMLRTSLPATLAVQNFSDGLLLSGLDDGIAVAEVMLLYQSAVLWSSLAPVDTAAVYSLVATAFLQPAAAMSPKGPAVLNGDSWQQLSSGFILLRGAAGDADPACSLPEVHVGGGRRLAMLPFSEGKLLVLAFLAEGSGNVAAGLDASAQTTLAWPARELGVALVDELKASRVEPGHVPGCRYLLHDDARCATYASPRSKVSATSHHARALATAISDSLSRLGDSAAPHPGGVPTPGGGQAVEEVWVKSSQDVWALARREDYRGQLLVVREKRKEGSLAGSLMALDSLVAEALAS